jgi:hypothetical protein
LEFRLKTSRHDLEATIHSIISAVAAERGVAVKESKLELSAPTARLLEFRLALAVKAMIVSTEVAAKGQAEIGSDLAVRITSIEVEGEGMIANMARGALEPQLAKVRGRAFPIAELKIPGLRVSDVAVAVADDVELLVTLRPA